MAEKYKRRTFLVRKKFQYVFVFKSLILSNISTVAIFVFLQSYFNQSENFVAKFRGDEAILLNEFFLVSQMNMELYFVSVFFITVVLTFLIGAYVSHRAAGPLFEFKRYLDSVSSGKEEVRDLRFRKGDFFHDLKDSFNKYQEFIQKKDNK